MVAPSVPGAPPSPSSGVGRPGLPGQALASGLRLAAQPREARPLPQGLGRGHEAVGQGGEGQVVQPQEDGDGLSHEDQCRPEAQGLPLFVRGCLESHLAIFFFF